ncbi:hypothetical protein D3C78_1704100 [compost metagenome]
MRLEHAQGDIDHHVVADHHNVGMVGEVLGQVLTHESGTLAGAGQLFVRQRVAMQLNDLHDGHPILRRDGVHRLPHGDAVFLGAVVFDQIGRDQPLIRALA